MLDLIDLIVSEYIYGIFSNSEWARKRYEESMQRNRDRYPDFDMNNPYRDFKIPFSYSRCSVKTFFQRLLDFINYRK